MSVTFKLPELGENIESGTVAAVRVSVGDHVEKDETLLELETDKAVVDVPSPAAGKVIELNASEGDTLNVGDVIAVIDDKNGDAAGDEEEKAEPESKEEPEESEAGAEDESADAEKGDEPEAPDETEDDGEESEDDDEETEDDSEKTEAKTEAEEEPEPAEEPEDESDDTAKAAAGGAAAASGKRVAAAPSVRRLAREIGVDINKVRPGEDHGRITKDDVKRYQKRKNSGGVSAPAATPGAIPTVDLPNFENFGPVRREKMSTVRQKTGERMAIAWASVPHVTQNDKADVTKLEEFRKQYGPRAEKEGGKLTPTSILVKVLAAALKEFPEFNTSIDVANQEIVYKDYYHIGIAVDTPRGLIVPVIRDVDEKSIIDLSVEISELAERARNAKTKLDELQGACITVTNLGGIGGTSFTPIVNPPEVAILGVSRAQLEPVYVDDELEPRLMMPLSLSYDHRVIDGANAARFCRWLCEAVENPFLMLLEG